MESDGSTQPTICPKRLRFESTRDSRADIGWTGQVYGSSQIVDSTFTVEIVDRPEDPECRFRDFVGPVPNSGEPNSQRCLSDTSVICEQDSDCPNFPCDSFSSGSEAEKICANDPSTICGDIADCDNAGACVYFYGPAIASATFNPQTMGFVGNVVNTFFGSPDPVAAEPPAPLQGSIDLERGDVDFTVFHVLAASRAGLGLPNMCVGDQQRNDGQKDGTCVQNDSPLNNLPPSNTQCDVNGTWAVMGSTAPYSFDCFVPVQYSVSVEYAPMSTAGAQWQLDGSRPDCTNGGGRCWCGVCEGTDDAGDQSFHVCAQDADCPAGRACVPPAAVPPTESEPIGYIGTAGNGCLNRECEFDPETQRGTCPIAEGSDARVQCFPADDDAIVRAPGSTETLDDNRYRISLGGLACTQVLHRGSSGNGVDLGIGNPGIKYIIQNFEVTKEY